MVFLKHFAAEQITDETIELEEGTARLIVTLYPKEVVRKRGIGGDPLAKKLRITDTAGVISFVRKDREVSYAIVPKMSPSGRQDRDRFIGVEISFLPVLDEMFGIRNVKRGVEPHGDLRDKIRERLRYLIPAARKKIEDIWGQASRVDKDETGTHGQLLEAVRDVDATMPKSRAESDFSDEDIRGEFERLADDIGLENEGEKQKYINRVKALPYVIESVDFPGTQFIDLLFLGSQVIIRLNTRHLFYREMWEPIKSIADAEDSAGYPEDVVKTARRAVEALTLMVIAFAKAQSMHVSPTEAYDELTNDWGKFLSTLLKKVKDVT